MKERTRESLRAAAFEATFVVLGVVLALAASEWREDRERAERARHILASILTEIKTNRVSVASSHEYHSGLLVAIKAAGQTSAPPDLRTFSRGFVSPANVYRTAWDSASATGAFEDIDYSTILKLSRVYAQQDRYERQAQSISPLLYGEIYREGTLAVLANYRNLASLIHTFVYREEELLETYGQTLADFQPPKP